MTLTELFSLLHELDEADKLRVIQFLANELVRQPANLFQSGESYEIWSPHRQQLKPKGDQNQTKAEKRKALYDGNHDDRHGANRVGCR